jgi:uncharacterized OsmC-like protein
VLKVKDRPTGATATLERFGHPRLVSRTGGELDVVTGASAPGFNPVDLLCASLAACLVISSRVAASRLGLMARFSKAEVDVTAVKNHEEPFRIIRFQIGFSIGGSLDADETMQIAHLAEQICTVSNTLKGEAALDLTVV